MKCDLSGYYSFNYVLYSTCIMHRHGEDSEVSKTAHWKFLDLLIWQCLDTCYLTGYLFNCVISVGSQDLHPRYDGKMNDIKSKIGNLCKTRSLTT